MFAMPSIWSILLSSIVFFVAAWYVRRLLIEQDIQKGFTLNVVVLTCATIASFGADKITNWIEHKVAGEKPTLSATSITSSDAQSAVKETSQE